MIFCLFLVDKQIEEDYDRRNLNENNAKFEAGDFGERVNKFRSKSAHKGEMDNMMKFQQEQKSKWENYLKNRSIV
jgi:hypothetical protein